MLHLACLADLPIPTFLAQLQPIRIQDKKLLMRKSGGRSSSIYATLEWDTDELHSTISRRHRYGTDTDTDKLTGDQQ